MEFDKLQVKKEKQFILIKYETNRLHLSQLLVHLL